MIRVDINKVTIEIRSWGRSMYGGYYADFKYVGGAYDGRYDGIRRDTIRELCAQLHISRTALNRDVMRVDN